MKIRLLLTAVLLPASALAQDLVAPMLEPTYLDASQKHQAAMAPTAVSGTTEIELKVKYLQTDCRAMLTLINDLRTGENAWYWNSDNSTKTICSNLSPLAIDADLEKLAMQRAAEQVVYYSHTRPDGRNCWTVYTDYNVSWNAVGENIAAGYSTYSAAFTGWEEANEDYSGQGHRRNMLSANFNAIGIGGAEYGGVKVWAQCLAKKNLNSNLGTANDVLTIVTIQMSDSHVTSLLVISPTDAEQSFTTVSDYSVSTSLDTNATMDSRLTTHFNTDGWVSDVLENYYPYMSNIKYIVANVNPTWTINPSTALTQSGTTLTRNNQTEATLSTTVYSQQNYTITVTPAHVHSFANSTLAEHPDGYDPANPSATLSGADALYSYVCDNGCGASDPNKSNIKVIKDFNGAGQHLELTLSGSSYSTTSAITLTDANGYIAPVPFSAPSVSYTRSLPGNIWGTMVLPFATSSNDNVQIYSLSSVVTGTNGMMTFAPQTSIAANTPFVFKSLTEAASSITFSASQATLAAAPASSIESVSGWTMKGTYSNLTEAAGQKFNPSTDAEGMEVYFIAQNAFWHANAALDMPAFRGWFEVAAGSQTPVRFNIEEDNNAQNIQFIEQESGDTQIFDLQGRRLNAPRTGLNIINGQKVVVR